MPRGTRVVSALILAHLIHVAVLRILLTAGVVGQFWTKSRVHWLSGLRARARVRVAETKDVWVVQVSVANVASWLAAVLIVDWVDVNERVVGSGRCSVDRVSKGCEGHICVDHGIVGWTVVILDFLQEDQIGRSKVVGDIVRDGVKIVRT